MNGVAIIGAGMAGLGAALELSRQGIATTVFEKSGGFSGRAATRGRDGVRYDFGANFFRLDEPRVERLLTGGLGDLGLARIGRPVWVFDAAGRVREGDREINAVPAWTCRDGISAVGKALAAAAARAQFEMRRRIASVRREGSGWWLVDDAGGDAGVYGNVLLAFPGPQMRELFVGERLRKLLAESRYRPQFCFVLGAAARPDDGRPWHALLNHDGRHPIAWLSFEDDKPGHVPPGRSVLVVQMSPQWTRDRFETDPAELLGEVRARVRELVDFPEPVWWDAQRWRHALPETAVDVEALREFEEVGLFFAGDAVVGKGRVVRALTSGLEAADRMIRRGCG